MLPLHWPRDDSVVTIVDSSTVHLHSFIVVDRGGGVRVELVVSC